MPSIIVKGMQCEHCRRAATEALNAVEGVAEVAVDLSTGKATWSEQRPVDRDKIKAALQAAGYEAE